MVDDLTGFQRDILYVIAGLEEPHGLAIKEELQSYYAQDINHGRLYPNLDDLVDDGLIKKGSIDKRTNSYTLSDRGYQVLKDRHEWKTKQVVLTEGGPV